MLSENVEKWINAFNDNNLNIQPKSFALRSLKRSCLRHTINTDISTFKMSVHPNHKFVLLLDEDRKSYRHKLYLLNLITGEYDFTIEAYGISSSALTPDGKTLVTASSDNTLRIWDPICGVCRQTLFGHEKGVYSVTISPDGQNILSCSADKTLRLWNIDSGKCI